MKDTQLKRQRDKDFFRAYQESLKKNSFATQKEAVNYTRLHSAERFYVSSQCLVNAIGRLKNGDPLKEMNDMSRKRYKELYRRYVEGRKNGRFDGMSRIECCEILVDEEAPEFYIGLELARDIICREIKLYNERYAERRCVKD